MTKCCQTHIEQRTHIYGLPLTNAHSKTTAAAKSATTKTGTGTALCKANAIVVGLLVATLYSSAG